MKIIVSINGVQEHQLDLQQGAYLIGRSKSCTITLGDRKVSREHARLTVKEKSYSIEDLKSSVGILSNGKEITKASFSGNRTFQIGDYTLAVFPSEGAGKSAIQPSHIFQKAAGIGKRPLACILIVQFLLVFLSIIAVWTFLGSQYQDFINDREKERAILLSDSLARGDIEQMISSTFPDNLFPEMEREAGITTIMLTDRLGNVKYPVDQLVEQVEYPSLVRSLASKKTEITYLNKNQFRICNPVLKNDQIIGFVIVDYHVRPIHAIAGGAGWIVFIGLIFIVLVVIFSGFLLRHLLFIPWNELAQKVGNSLETGKDRINLHESYQEITKIKILFERLLVRAGQNKGKSVVNACAVDGVLHPVKEKSSSGTLAPGAERLGNAMGRDSAASGIIDRKTGRLLDYTKGFSLIFPVDYGNQNHVIELFQDSGAVEVVLEIMKAGTGKGRCTIEGRNMSLSGEPVKQNENHIRIQIEKDDE